MNLPPSRTRWPREWLELWAERAAIMEVEGHLSRFTAEIRAEQDIRKLAAKSDREHKGERTA